MRSRSVPSRSALASEPIELGQGGEVDAAAGLHRLDAEGDGQVGLAAAGLAEEVDDLVAVDEVELGQGEDAVAVERGLEGEVEAGQRLDVEQPAHLERRLDPAALAQAELLGEQAVDRLEGGDLAALELAQQMLEHLERARHPEADEVAADAVERGGRRRSSRRLPGGEPPADGLVDGQRARGHAGSPGRGGGGAGPRARAWCCWRAAAGCGGPRRCGAGRGPPARDGRRSARRPRGCAPRWR